MQIPILYLFQVATGEIFAVSTDKTGCNIPKLDSAWLLQGEVMPDRLPADAALTAYKEGFCMVDPGDIPVELKRGVTWLATAMSDHPVPHSSR